jgi:hypothetical protein
MNDGLVKGSLDGMVLSLDLRRRRERKEAMYR